MALGLQIITDNGSLDLFKDEHKNFYVTRQVFDINDLQARKADYTRTISVPATSVNRNILGASHQLEHTHNKEQSIDCRIILDGITIAPSAKLLHTSTELLRGVQSFNVVILYGNFNLFDSIKGGGINEMNWADIAIEWTETGLEAISNNTSSHVWALADWFNVGESMEVLAEDEEVWDIKQGGLFIYSKEIIERIIAEAGFTVKYTNTPIEFDNHALAIPVTQFIVDEEPKGSVESGSVGAFLDRTATGETLKAIFSNVISNPDSMWDAANNYYVAQISEDFTIVLQGKVTYSQAKANTADCEIRIVKNGGDIIKTEYFEGDATDEDFFISITEPLSIGDTIQIDLFAPIDGNKDSVLTLDSTSLFDITEIGGDPSNEVQPELYIPEIERKSYLVGVLAHYGLMIKTDSVLSEVEIKPLENIEDDIEQDWSNNLDIGGTKSISEELALTGYARNNKFEYTADSKTKRTDSDTLVTSTNEILSLNKTLITLPYSASDPSILYLEDRIKMLRVPFVGQSREFYGDGITMTGSSFVLSVANDFHVGNYLMVPLIGGDEYYYIDSKSSDTSGTVLGTPTFSGLVSNYYIVSKASDLPQPRTAIIRTAEHNVTDTLMTKQVRYLSDGTNVNKSQALPDDHRSAHFLDCMLFSNILINSYHTLIASVLHPQFIQAWFNFNASSFVDIDFFKPVYISQLSGRYFINKIDQYKSNESVRVDLVRIDEESEDPSLRVTVVDQTVETVIHTEKLNINGGSDILPGTTIDFEKGDSLVYSFRTLTVASGSGDYMLVFKNDLSQTEIARFSTTVLNTLHTLTIVPRDEVNWEGGNITVTAQIYGA